MKKFLSIVALSFMFVNTAFAAMSIEDRMAKVDASAQKQIDRVATYKTYTDEMKSVKVKQIKANAELRKNQIKEWSALKDKVKAEKTATRKSARKSKKA
jgi:hypothetical protein